MRKLILLTCLIAGLWAGAWALGAALIRGQMAALLAPGSRFAADSFTLAGFPNRFDLHFQGLKELGPSGAPLWQSHDLRLYAMGWKPWHIILQAFGPQTFTWEGQSLTLTGTRLEASLRARPRGGLPLARGQAHGEGVALQGPLGPLAEMAGFDLALEAQAAPEGGAETLRLGLRARDLILAERPPLQLRTEGLLHLSGPLMLTSGAPPLWQGLDLTALEAEFAGMRLSGAGVLVPGRGGQVEGRVDFQLAPWAPLLPLLVAEGLIAPASAPKIEAALRELEESGGVPGQIALPLLFENGGAWLGPFPLGPAPFLPGY